MPTGDIVITLPLLEEFTHVSCNPHHRDPLPLIDYMASEHLLIPNRHLLFGIFITRLLKQLKFDLSIERSIELSVDINNTLLKRMRARERVPAP